MDRRRVMAALLAGMIGLSGCAAEEEPAVLPPVSSEPEQIQPIVLKVGSQSAEDSSEIQVIRRFEQLVEEASGGTLDIQVYTDSGLGAVSDLIEGMSVGTIEMATVCLNSYSALCSDFAVYDMWSFKEPEEFVRLYESQVGRDLNRELTEEAGIRILSYNLCGTGRLYFWGNELLETMDGYRGLKIRTNSSSACAAAISALHALPVSVPWTDMAAALRTEVINVASGDVENMLASGFCDQVAYRYDTPPNFMGSSLCISEKVFELLDAQQQEWIQSAAVQACQEYGSALFSKRAAVNEALVGERVTTLFLPEEEKAEMSRRIDASLQTYLASVVSPELLEETQRVLCGTE